MLTATICQREDGTVVLCLLKTEDDPNDSEKKVLMALKRRLINEADVRTPDEWQFGDAVNSGKASLLVHFTKKR
ncbi:MAG: hypothetical protein PHT44_01205 [Candidatus Portnoybacteria bacterium]|nr:hypothetical protein [Candidatus Portnoybacteria bacterium]